MSFLEKEGEKSSAVWDWVIGIGILLLVGGFTMFYQYQKRFSREQFQLADSLFHQEKFKESASVYEKLKNAHYLTPAFDSLIYSRLDSVESMAEREKEAISRLRAKLDIGDSAGVRMELRQPFKGLLSPENQVFLDSLKGYSSSP